MVSDAMEQAQGLQESDHGDVESLVPDRSHVGLFVLEAGDGDPSLLPPELRIPLDQVRSWVTNEPIALAYEVMTASVLAGMWASSMLHQFSKLRFVPRALWRVRHAKGGSVSPMCSFCLATGDEEWTLHHDRDCPWQREANRCARCGFVTWWNEFMAEEQCQCMEEGMVPDV